jgi:hypothetical protein
MLRGNRLGLALHDAEAWGSIPGKLWGAPMLPVTSMVEKGLVSDMPQWAIPLQCPTYDGHPYSAQRRPRLLPMSNGRRCKFLDPCRELVHCGDFLACAAFQIQNMSL